MWSLRDFYYSGVIHKCLSPNNILVTHNTTVKITDYCSPCHAKECDDDDDDANETNPAYWSAPEVLTLDVYTCGSDVWSYGCVLWSLFSIGKRPYPGLNSSDISSFLQRGQRMEPPENCPVVVSNVMMKCWNQTPELRPSFDVLSEMLGQVTKSVENTTQDAKDM